MSENRASKLTELCTYCGKAPFKYKCPKCNFRTCSLACSKMHKFEDRCDALRPEFTPISQADDYKEKISIEDQCFLQKGQKLIVKSLLKDGEISGDLEGIKETSNAEPSMLSCFINDDKVRHFLLTNCRKRRIWLDLDGIDDINNSRHERISDTIFWTVSLQFTRKDQLDAAYCYTVQNIPESLTLKTLINQFLHPKLIGTIVSEGDLNLEKLTDFQNVGIDALCFFMPVFQSVEKRFYVIDANKTLLENLRNRSISNYPKLIVTLDTEADDFVILTNEEAQLIREVRRQKLNQEQSNFGHFSRGNRGGKRRFSRQFGNNPNGKSFQKRGNFHRGRPFHQYSNQRPFPNFDPRISRPIHSNFDSGNSAQCSWNLAVENPSKLADLPTQKKNYLSIVDYDDLQLSDD